MGAPNHQFRESDGQPARSRIGQVQLRVHHAGQLLAPQLPNADDLAAQLRAVLSGMGHADDDSYWVIKRLNIQFTSGPGGSGGDISEAFARALRDVLARVLAGQIVQGVRRFDSRAQWFAECLWAASAGDLGHAWHFARYRHLGPLPAGDQFRLVVAAEPDVALPALSILSRDGRLAEVMRRISETPARGTLKFLTAPAKVRADVPLVRDFAGRVARLHRTETLGRYSAAICVLIDHQAKTGAEALPSWQTVDRALPAAVASVSSAVPEAERRAIPATDVLPQKATADNNPLGNPVQGDPRALAASSPVASATAEILVTRFAGVFVLWRSVTSMKLLSLLPDEAGHRLALAAALTGPSYAAALLDPALHWLTGFNPEKDAVPQPPTNLGVRFVAHYAEWRFPRPVIPSQRRVGRSFLLQDSTTEDWLAHGTASELAVESKKLGPLNPSKVGARDPLVDADWFGVTHRRARRQLVLLARATFADFARRLHGLDRASAKWCWEQLLAGQGQLAVDKDAVITLPRVALDIVLRMGALDGCQVPAAHGPVTLRLPGGRDAV